MQPKNIKTFTRKPSFFLPCGGIGEIELLYYSFCCFIQVMTSAANQRRPAGGGGSSGSARRRYRHAATSDNGRPVITAGEAALLAEIQTKFADKPWIVDSAEMPWSGQLVRPSSAAANLQTHPSYTSGLFDTATVARSVSGRRYLQRPKTGSPGFWSYGRTAGRNAPTSGWKQERRLTVTGVESISESNIFNRHTFVQRSLHADLKVKVCH